MAFEKIVTDEGNFGEVARKAQNTANQIRTRMFGKISPLDRISVIRENAKLLMRYADCLEMIWNTEKAINEKTYEPAGGYIRLTKEFYDENIHKPAGNGEGSGEGPVRDGDQVSEQDSPGPERRERSEVSDD